MDINGVGLNNVYLIVFIIYAMDMNGVRLNNVYSIVFIM